MDRKMNTKKDTTEKIVKKLNKIINEKDKEIFRLKSIIDTLPVSVYWKDKKGVYLGFNKAGADSAEKFNLPYQLKEVIGKSDHDLFPKEMADVFRKNDLEVMHGNKELIFEEVTMLPSGEKAIQLSTKKPLYDEKENIVGIIGSTVDISYLKKIESDLKEAKEKLEHLNQALHQAKESAEWALENIVAHMPGHMYWKNKAGVYLGCNDRQAQSLGFSRGSELIGKTDQELPWDVEVALRFQANDQHVLMTGQTVLLEEAAFLTGGEEILLSQKTPLKNKCFHLSSNKITVGLKKDLKSMQISYYTYNNIINQ